MTKFQKLSSTKAEPHDLRVSNNHELIDTNRRSPGRMTGAELFLASGPEEVLVVEDRAHLRPAQVVESKFTRMLQEASFPVSHLQTRGLLSTR